MVADLNLIPPFDLDLSPIVDAIPIFNSKHDRANQVHVSSHLVASFVERPADHPQTNAWLAELAESGTRMADDLWPQVPDCSCVIDKPGQVDRADCAVQEPQPARLPHYCGFSSVPSVSAKHCSHIATSPYPLQPPAR